MENLDILEKLGKVAGIAGIAVGAIVLIFGGIIQKNIFPGMTKEQGFRVIRMMIVAASVLAVFGIGAWVYTEFQKNKTEKAASLIQKHIVGTIQTQTGLGIPSVQVSIARSPGMKDRSDSDGKFYLAVEGVGKKYLDVVFNHSEYDVVRKKVTVDFDNSDVDEVSIGEIVMVNSYPPEEGVDNVEPRNPTGGNQPERQSPTNPGGNVDPSSGDPTKRTDYTNQRTNITVLYDDEGTGCNLDIQIQIGNLSFYPQTNPVTLLDLPLGTYNYSVTGTAYCPTGQCATVTGVDPAYLDMMSGGDAQIKEKLSFFNEIKIVQGGMYYLVFDPSTCLVGIADKQTYDFFNSLNF